MPVLRWLADLLVWCAVWAIAWSYVVVILLLLGVL